MHSRLAYNGGMAYALQATELYVMLACHMCHKEASYNDGIAYVSQAKELHITRLWHMLI